MDQEAPTPTKLVKRNGKEVSKGRIAPALRSAIKLITEQGYTVADAAKAVGYQTHSLTQALNKPHVKAARAAVVNAWRSSETFAAWAIVSGLAKEGVSEDVKLKAARTILQAAGELDPKADTGGGAQTLINIVLNSGRSAEVFDDRLPGVIEAPQPMGRAQ